ncbi:MAG TPA: PEP-CTERM sorting domain-containing protein [Vicinamibacterales bacterium]|nr:PEP-CTERM sorting domain-containing protein [Vicinamibacterales bacterium]
MKKCVCGFGLAAILLFASNASAIPLATVGGVDTLVAWDTLADSGEATEESFIEAFLGGDVVYEQFDLSGGEDVGAWQAVDGNAGLFAFDFQGFGATNPEYFLVKTGNGVGFSPSAFTHYLYQNTSQLRYGVIDLGIFDQIGNGKITIGKVSHVGVAGVTAVPEPASLSLMVFGLAGIGAASRKFKTVR